MSIDTEEIVPLHFYSLFTQNDNSKIDQLIQKSHFELRRQISSFADSAFDSDSAAYLPICKSTVYKVFTDIKNFQGNEDLNNFSFSILLNSDRICQSYQTFDNSNIDQAKENFRRLVLREVRIY